MDELDLKDYCYVCYSLAQYNKFEELKIRPFIKGRNDYTNKIFWIYPKTKQVLEILDKWKQGYWKR